MINQNLENKDDLEKIIVLAIEYYFKEKNIEAKEAIIRAEDHLKNEGMG